MSCCGVSFSAGLCMMQLAAVQPGLRLTAAYLTSYPSHVREGKQDPVQAQAKAHHHPQIKSSFKHMYCTGCKIGSACTTHVRLDDKPLTTRPSPGHVRRLGGVRWREVTMGEQRGHGFFTTYRYMHTIIYILCGGSGGGQAMTYSHKSILHEKMEMKKKASQLDQSLLATPVKHIRICILYTHRLFPCASTLPLVRNPSIIGRISPLPRTSHPHDDVLYDAGQYMSTFPPSHVTCTPRRRQILYHASRNMLY